MANKSARVGVKLLVDSKSVGSGLAKAERKFKLFGKNITLGFKEVSLLGAAALAKLGASAARFATEGLKSFGNFDTEMRRVWTLLPEESEASFDAISQQVRDLSTKWGADASDAARALYDIFSRGGEGIEKSLEALELSLKGSLLTGQDAQSIGAFFLEISKLAGTTTAKIADLGQAAVRVGGFDLAQLGQNLGELVPHSKAAKVSIEEVLAALATLTTQGFTIQKSRTSLIQVFAQANKDGTALNALIKSKLGKSFEQLTSQGEDFVAILHAALAGLSSEEINKVVGSVEAGGNILALTQNIGKYADKLDTIGKSTGEYTAAIERVSGGVGLELSQLSSQWNELKLVFGQALADSGVVGELIKGLKTFGESKAFKEMADALAEIVSSLLSVSEGFGKSASLLAKGTAGLASVLDATIGGGLGWIDKISAEAAGNTEEQKERRAFNKYADAVDENLQKGKYYDFIKNPLTTKTPDPARTDDWLEAMKTYIDQQKISTDGFTDFQKELHANLLGTIDRNFSDALAKYEQQKNLDKTTAFGLPADKEELLKLLEEISINTGTTAEELANSETGEEPAAVVQDIKIFSTSSIDPSYVAELDGVLNP